VERLLQWVPLAVREAINRGDLTAIGLDRQDGAALDRDPIEVDGACAAVRGVAPDGCAGLPDALPQVVHQQQAGLDVVLIADAIDPDGNSWSSGLLLWRRLWLLVPT